MNLMEVNVAGDGTVQTADGQPLEISPLQVPSQVRAARSSWACVPSTCC